MTKATKLITGFVIWIAVTTVWALLIVIVSQFFHPSWFDFVNGFASAILGYRLAVFLIRR